MKKIALFLITLITLINVSYASFPIENELIEISNQIDNTENIKEKKVGVAGLQPNTFLHDYIKLSN